MAFQTAFPPEFDGSWDEFLREWCCGGSLGYNTDEAALALSTLRRLWPAKVRRLVNEPARKVLDAVAEIEELLVYFEAVAPERSDASEADQQLVDKLTAAVRARVSKCRIEIEILGSREYHQFSQAVTNVLVVDILPPDNALI